MIQYGVEHDGVIYTQYSGPELQFPMPEDFCNGFEVELKDGRYRAVNKNEVIFHISTFGVQHFYLSVHVYTRLAKLDSDGDPTLRSRAGAVMDVNGNIVEYPESIELEILREVTKEDKEACPIRWADYDEGDLTNAFDSRSELMEIVEKIKKWFPDYTHKIE